MKDRDLPYPQLPPLLRKCWMRLNAIFQKRVATVGLTPDQYTALRWLNELPKGTVSQSTLKKMMFTDPNNIAGLMGRMEKLDLVERITDLADRRRKLIYCTNKGQALFAKAKSIANQLEEDVLSVLTEGEKTVFLSFLCEINRYFHQDSEIHPSD
jgi:DNA-binding MarR family transcriptional regulator